MEVQVRASRAASAQMTNLPREIKTFDFVLYFYAKDNLQKEEPIYRRRDMTISGYARVSTRDKSADRLRRRPRRL
jgi:hypothetical protein